MRKKITNMTGARKASGISGEDNERQRLEKALRESEERFWSALEHFPSGVAITKGDRHLYVNQQFLNKFGYSHPGEIIGEPISKVVHPSDREMVLEYNRMRQKGLSAPERYELRGIRKDGTTIFLEITATSIQHDNDRMSLVFFRNITKQKNVEEALKESELQKSAILDASFDRIRYVDRDLRIIWSNKTAVNELGMSEEDSVGHVCYEVSRGRDTPCEGCPTVMTRQTGQIERAILHEIKEKGAEGDIYWDTCCVPLKADSGDLVGFLQLARNITDQKLAEEQITTLSQQLLRAQENERQRMSRDLHDHIAQDLSSLKICCETLFDNQQGIPEELKKRVTIFSRVLQKAITDVRDMAYALRPPELDQMGLIRTLQEYCEDFSDSTGLRVDFESAGMERLDLDFDTEINLYRLIQEALSNISKHADANNVIIKFISSFPKIILRIEDDGKGFDVTERMGAALKKEHMGLHSMSERVGLLQGSMRIQSRPGEGTKIFIEIPYYREKKNGTQKDNSDR